MEKLCPIPNLSNRGLADSINFKSFQGCDEILKHLHYGGVSNDREWSKDREWRLSFPIGDSEHPSKASVENP